MQHQSPSLADVERALTRSNLSDDDRHRLQYYLRVLIKGGQLLPPLSKEGRDWDAAVISGEAFPQSWEDLYTTAHEALKAAHVAIDDIAGWSGSSGNWPLQDASSKVRRALEVMDELPYPNDCECHRALNDYKDGVWFGPCEDKRNHKAQCPAAVRAGCK